MKLYLSILCIVSSMSISILANAQYYKHYDRTNGLLTNYVYNVSTDRKGYVWLCTDKGVIRFDGEHFKNYTVADGLTDNEILGCYEDVSNRLWFRTLNGTFCYYKDGIIYNKSNTPFLGRLHDCAFVTTFYENKLDSTLYFGFAASNQPIQKLKSGNVVIINTPQAFSTNVKAIVPLDGSDIIRVYASDGYFSVRNDSAYGATKHKFIDLHYNYKTFITAREDGVSLYRNDSLLWSVTDNGVGYRSILTQYYDGDRLLFSGTSKGLITYDIRTGRKKNFLANAPVSSVCIDADSNYWVSTFDRGVFYFDKSNFNDAYLVKDLTKYELINTSGNQIFLKKGDSLEIWSDSIGQFLKIPFPIAFGSKPLLWHSKVLYCHKNIQRGFTKVIRTAGVEENATHFFYKAYALFNHNVLVTNFYTLYKLGLGDKGHLQCLDSFRTSGIISRQYIKEIESLFFTTRQNIFYRYDARQSKISVVDTLLNVASNSHVFYGNGRIYLVTNNRSISVYDTIQSGPIKKLELDFLLFDIIHLGDNKVLLNTSNGYKILRLVVNRHNTELLQYPFPQRDIVSITKTDSTLLFQVGDALYSIPPGELNKHVPQLRFYIEKIQLNGRNMPSHGILTSVDEANLAIFSNAVYFGGSKLIYRYRISREGAMGNWQYTENGDFNFSLSSLGDYIIEMQVAPKGGKYTGTKAIYLTVKPSFFRSYSFLAICILAFIGLSVWIIRYIIQKRKRAFSNEMKFLKLEHRATNALLNPHFIFNAINNIQNLINHDSKEQASEYLSTLSIMVRQNIENLQFNFISLEKELDLIRNYVDLQNLRFENGIAFTLNNQVGEEYFIPPLLIQTFVENAIIHGYDRGQEDFLITISISVKNSYLNILIRDNGTGINATQTKKITAKKSSSVGISFTRKRLERLSVFTNKPYSLIIRDVSEYDTTSHGTEVTISIYALMKELIENEPSVI